MIFYEPHSCVHLTLPTLLPIPEISLARSRALDPYLAPVARYYLGLQQSALLLECGLKSRPEQKMRVSDTNR